MAHSTERRARSHEGALLNLPILGRKAALPRDSYPQDRTVSTPGSIRLTPHNQGAVMVPQARTEDRDGEAMIRLESFETRPKPPYTHAVRAKHVPRQALLDGKFAAIKRARETEKNVYLIEALRPTVFDGYGWLRCAEPPVRPGPGAVLQLEEGVTLRVLGTPSDPEYRRYELVRNGKMTVSHDWDTLCWTCGWRGVHREPEEEVRNQDGRVRTAAPEGQREPQPKPKAKPRPKPQPKPNPKPKPKEVKPDGPENVQSLRQLDMFS